MQNPASNYDGSLPIKSNPHPIDVHYSNNEQDTYPYTQRVSLKTIPNSQNYMSSDHFDNYLPLERQHGDSISIGGYRKSPRSLSERLYSGSMAMPQYRPNRWSYQESRFDYPDYAYSPTMGSFDHSQDQDVIPSDLTPRSANMGNPYSKRLQPIYSSSLSPHTTPDDEYSYSFDSLLPNRLRRSPDYPTTKGPLPSPNYNSHYDPLRASQAFTTSTQNNYMDYPMQGTLSNGPRVMSVPSYSESNSRFSTNVNRPCRSLNIDSYPQELYTDSPYIDIPTELYDESLLYAPSTPSLPLSSSGVQLPRARTDMRPLNKQMNPNSLSTGGALSPSSTPVSRSLSLNVLTDNKTGISTNSSSISPNTNSNNQNTGNGSLKTPHSSVSVSSTTSQASKSLIKEIPTIPKWAPNNRAVCKTLQELVDVADEDMMNALFQDIQANLFEIMMDQFGNYFFQKFAKKCNDDVITQLYNSCKDNLLKICYDNQGSRCIQILIERTKTSYQRDLLLNAVLPDVSNMSINTHANHVIQHILEYFPYECVLPIIKDLQNSLPYLSSAKYGCYVLQKAFSVSPPQEKEIFVNILLPTTLDTVNDAFGNYVVQHFIENCDTEYARQICEQLMGHIVDLSCRKMSSNVIESCLKRSDLEDIHIKIVNEFCQCSDLPRLRKPGYASFVINRILKMKDSVSGPLKQLIAYQTTTATTTDEDVMTQDMSLVSNPKA